jgi:hypothetical protein
MLLIPGLVQEACQRANQLSLQKSWKSLQKSTQGDSGKAKQLTFLEATALVQEACQPTKQSASHKS